MLSPKGLPQLICSTGQLLPITLGLREFESHACVLCETNSPLDQRMRLLLDGLGVSILNGDKRFVLSTTDTFASEAVLNRLRKYVLNDPRCRSGLFWNYTAGTKPMAIAIDRYLGPGENESPLAGMFYIDTRASKPLFIDGLESYALRARLNVSELIRANSWCILAALRVQGPLQPPEHVDSVRELRAWTSKQANSGTSIRVLGDFKHVSMGSGDCFTLRVAGDLVRYGVVDEVWAGVKVLPASARSTGGVDQDVDLAMAIDNTLVVVECKDTQANIPDAVLKLKQIAQSIGGMMSRAVYIRRAPKRNAVDVKGTGLGKKAREHGVAAMYWDPCRSREEAVKFARLLRCTNTVSTDRTAHTLT